MSISAADPGHPAQDSLPCPSPAINLAEVMALDDPYPRYAELRRSGRILKGGPAQWIVTHHADVAPLLRDRRLVHRMPREYLEFELGVGASASFREHSLLNRDGSDHQRLRVLMGKAFSAPLVRRMRDHIADLLEPLLDPLLSGETFDVVDRIAHPLPSQVICELLGIEGVDRAEVRRKVADLVSLDHARADAAIEWSRDYLGEVLAERRPDPDGDLLERMLAAEDGDDALSHDEIVDNAVLLFFAGFETTKHLISAGVEALLRFPDQLDRLLTDPALAPTAVEEFLRFDSPVRDVSVVTTEPMEVCRPEHMWQVTHPDLPDSFPPLRSMDVVRNNLPVQLTSFVGRAREMDQLQELLDESRCVTLTGSGGCGKTRLGAQAAADRLDDHPAGVWVVDLSTFDSDEAVAAAVAQVLSLAPLPSGTDELIVRTIGASRVLVLLDNCEHLIEACAAMTELLLRRCPGVTVVATSREPLGVPGEVTFRVPSLAYPKARAATAEELVGFDAVQLFVERARRARPSFAITDANAGEVLEICKRLEGIPLALELAAARLRVMSAAQIRDGLHDRFRLLTGGARTAVPRQQTLQASVDWSYGLLSDRERRVLDRLSVFSGGFTMVGAETVCSEGEGDDDVLDLVLALVDKSLVVAEDEAERRFTLLETVRQYAASRLADAGDSEAVRRRHYDHSVELCRNQPSHGDTDASYRAAVTADYDNLRRALQWASEEANPARRSSALSRLAQLLSLIGDPARADELRAEALQVLDTTGDRRAALWARLAVRALIGAGFVRDVAIS